MRDVLSPRTGAIKSAENNIVFYGDKYHFTFMKSDLEAFSNHKEISIPTKNEFIFGNTHENKKIAIYVGSDSLKMINTRKLTTCMYAVEKWSCASISNYNSIRFFGGILNSLFTPDAVDLFITDDKLEFKNDTITFNILNNSIKAIKIGSYITQSHSEIKNKDVFLELVFEKTQDLGNFFNSYNRIIDALSIMTNRRNIGFEKITLINDNPNSPIGYVEVAEVFVRLNECLTEKNKYSFITFSTLGDSFINLINYVFDEHHEKLVPELSIIPQNDKKSLLCTNDLIRSVCSSLELEISLTDLPLVNDEKQKIDNLVSQIKSLIKEHRQTNEKLNDDTYSLINGSMKNWNATLANRIEALYKPYESIMNKIFDLYMGCDNFSIKAFVKYRNNISHGTALFPDKTVGYTTMVLRTVVYCSFLSRIGLSLKAIEEKMINGFWC